MMKETTAKRPEVAPASKKTLRNVGTAAGGGNSEKMIHQALADLERTQVGDGRCQPLDR
jgi:hypothetical protein